MFVQTLKIIASYRSLSQSELSRLAGVSRQRISQWFAQETYVNVGTKTLAKLANSLNIPTAILLEPIPSWREATEESAPHLLFDYIYPDLAQFIRAVIIGRSHALARLVDIYGLFTAANIAGKQIWRRYPKFKHHIPPKRREELDRIWHLQKNLKLI